MTTPSVISIWCESPEDAQPTATHDSPRLIRRYERNPQGDWEANLYSPLTGTQRLADGSGMREVFDPIPEYLKRDEPDNEWSRKLRCSCGISALIRREDLALYLDEIEAAGVDRLDLALLGKQHHRRIERTRRREGL